MKLAWRHRLTVLLLASLVLSYLAAAPMAQFGEEAGALGFQVQVGHNQTLQLHLLNAGNTIIGFRMQVPSVTQQDNQITPTVTVSPMFGTIFPYSSFAVNVTVFMPLNNTPHAATWTFILSAIEASNASNPGGAVLQAGVAKIVTIQAVVSTTTSTIPQKVTVGAPTITLPPNALVYVGIGVVVVICVAGAAWVLRRRKATKPRKAKAPKKKAARKAMKKRRRG
jgi:hypothetical protein